MKRKINSLFEDALNQKRKRIYFDKYQSGKSLDEVALVDEFKDKLKESSISEESVDLQYARLLELDNEPVLFYSHQNGGWIIIYSSRLNEDVRRKLSDLSKLKGWLIQAWIPGETVDSLYEEYSPEGENISLKRNWDPYFLYKRESKVPEEYRQYFSEHPREFSQQNVQVEIKTPKWRLEETMEKGMTDFLEAKSETEQSEFTMETLPEMGVSSDGGAVVPVQSSVKVKESGKITHQSGDIGATFKLVDETVERSSWVYDLFDKVSSSYEYNENEDGSLTLSNYRRPQPLLFRIPDRFTKEISIKLSNFLTVGQKDVDLFGIVTSREGKEFAAETQVPFNNDEYTIFVTSQQESKETALYLRPSSGSTQGLVYFYHKLQQKFNPNLDVEEVDRFPKQKEAAN